MTPSLTSLLEGYDYTRIYRLALQAQKLINGDSNTAHVLSALDREFIFLLASYPWITGDSPVYDSSLLDEVNPRRHKIWASSFYTITNLEEVEGYPLLLQRIQKILVRHEDQLVKDLCSYKVFEVYRILKAAEMGYDLPVLATIKKESWKNLPNVFDLEIEVGLAYDDELCKYLITLLKEHAIFSKTNKWKYLYESHPLP